MEPEVIQPSCVYVPRHASPGPELDSDTLFLPSDVKDIKFQFKLEDLETIRVIRKGSFGVVKLVRLKWSAKLFALKVLQDLVYLHNERQILHRNIKPSSLLINQKGDVKIAQIGVTAVQICSGASIGAFNYMAPKQFAGSTCKYYTSDIWSLVLVIFECAIGCFPYMQYKDEKRWSSFYELQQTIVGKPPPSIPRNQFSPQFCSFISACLQKDPRERSSSADLLNHPFIKKYEDKGIYLGILVKSLESSMDLSR